jgi:hypothetical protein
VSALSGRSESSPRAASGEIWLTAVRIVWLIAAATVLLFLIPELQATFATAKQLCKANCASFQLTAQQYHALRGIGFSLDGYSAYNVALVLVNVAVCYTVACAMMLRRTRDRMVLMTAFTSVLGCTPNILTLSFGGGLWARPTQVVGVLGPVGVWFFLYSFPTGHFVPRWTVILAAAWVVMNLLPSSNAFASSSLGNASWVLLAISLIAVQVYRYRRVSTPVQRQQTKLVVLGIGYLCSLLVVGTVLSAVVTGAQNQAVPTLFFTTALALFPVPIIGSVGLAVLRYRLWDIDVFISRTLGYLALTASLGLLYLGSVVGFQALFRAVTGQQSYLAIAISTLIIAGLFNPLRHRFQSLIARTFYRRKYDAAKVLATFGATCRDETDLARLQAGLVRVVEETLQPAHVSLWVRKAALGTENR